MNPGKLDRRVSLRQLELAIDAIGGFVSSWPHQSYVWAQWLPEMGREFISAQTRIAEAVGVLRIRYRADILATWRVVVDGVAYEVAAPPVQVGRRSFLDLIIKSVPDTASLWPLSNVFDVDLVVGSVSKTVVYPAAFQSAPAGVYVQLVVPTGQASFPITVSDQTASGFTVDFGASVPTTGYKLSVQAFQYQMTYTEDLVEGTSQKAVVFSTEMPSVPRGLKVTLQSPVDGYEFTTALVVKSLTKTGFSLEYGAVVPGPGYKVLVQVSL